MSIMTTAHQGIQRPPVEVSPQVDLSTDRVVFRTLGYGDQGAFLDALERSRRSVRRWFPLERRGESTRAYFERLVISGVTAQISGSAWRRAVFTPESEFVGMVNLIKISRGLSWNAELNLWIDKKFRGSGFGSHCVEAATDHALADLPVGLGLNRVRAWICLDNRASCRLFEGVGYERTGEHELLEVNDAMVAHHGFEIVAKV